jgi:hypothetical protein
VPKGNSGEWHVSARRDVESQATDLRKRRVGIDRGQSVPCDERDDLPTQYLKGNVWWEEHRRIPSVGQPREAALDVRQSVNGNDDSVPGLGLKSLNRMELSNRSPGCILRPEGDRAMNPPDEFLKHAADCEQMAKFARDAESKTTWNRMAERWRRCAEKFTTESLAAHHAMLAKRRQGVAPDWAHH